MLCAWIALTSRVGNTGRYRQVRLIVVNNIVDVAAPPVRARPILSVKLSSTKGNFVPAFQLLE
jgi:hypothetical protein